MKSIFSKSIVALIVAVLCLSSSSALAYEHRDNDENRDNQDNACTKTAEAAHKACKNDIQDNYWITFGNCMNLSDPAARDDCMKAAAEELLESKELCEEQEDARSEICEELGGGPYDPVVNPGNFVDFKAVVNGEESLVPNQYFPLVPGTIWQYITVDGDGNPIERILTEVLFESKEILGVNCVVVHDRVWEIGEGGEETLVEDTDDWYAQDTLGNVWYFGEISLSFEGGLLDNIDGSWMAGKDFAKPGYIMLADPQEGDIYRQEFALGEAEDMAAVENRGEESVNVPFGAFSVDVLKTRDFSPVEPDVVEFKYYAPGIGAVLETNPDTGERVELIDMTTP